MFCSMFNNNLQAKKNVVKIDMADVIFHGWSNSFKENMKRFVRKQVYSNTKTHPYAPKLYQDRP